MAPSRGAVPGVSVALALNGQQYHDAPESYAYIDWDPPTSLAIASPTSGPVYGATSVTIEMPSGSSASLEGGDDYRCRYAANSVASDDTRRSVFADTEAGLVTRATYHPDQNSITCLSPASASALSSANVTLELALNALVRDLLLDLVGRIARCQHYAAILTFVCCRMPAALRHGICFPILCRGVREQHKPSEWTDSRWH